MTAMQSLSDAPLAATLDGATMPRFQDGTINMQELLRQLAESVVNEIMDAEADQMCGEGVFVKTVVSWGGGTAFPYLLA